MVKTLALIPARGGSKSIPRKNIRLLGGHPLIAYSICVARACPLVDRVIVSTDDDEIARVSQAYGAEVPFRRPAEISGDRTTDLPVFEHALQWLREHEDGMPELVVHLRPTSPFLPLALLREGIEKMLATPGADSARAVCVPAQPPFKMWTIGAGGFMKPLLSIEGVAEPYNTPRQLLPAVWWQTGYLDVVRARTISDKHSMTGESILPLMMDAAACVDIDTELEWQFAEHLLRSGAITMASLGYTMPVGPKANGGNKPTLRAGGQT